METWGEKILSPEDAFDTLTPLYRLLNVFSLISVNRVNKNLKVSYSKVRRIIVIILFICLTIVVSTFKILNYSKFYDPVTKRSIKFSDSLQVTYLLEFGHFIMGFYFVSKHGGDPTLKYFKVYHQIDQVLGMAYNGVIRSKVANITAFTCFVCVFTSVLDGIAWSISCGWVVPSLYSVEYLFFFLNTLVIIEMTANIIQVEYRLRTVGDVLQDYYSKTSNTGVKETGVNDKMWINEYNGKKNKVKPESPKFLDYNYYYDFVWLNKCYLLLLEQNSFINRTFGFRVLINNAYLLLCMVNSVNLALRIANGIIVLPDHSYFPALTSLLRTLNCGLIIVSLVHQCERSYSQSERIISIIDHILVDKNINTSMRNVLSETRSLVLTRPIQFNAMKFYNLDYRLLDSAISVFVTLTVILLQNVQ